MCQEAVYVLDQRDNQSGKKKASDAAYTLAMHLFAYELNQAAGACISPTAEATSLLAQDLLSEYDYDGTGTILSNKAKDKTDYYYALELAEILDQYNNGFLCGQ
jgi:hypothetical protein